MPGTAAHMNKVVQPGAVGHRRGIDHRIPGGHRVDIDRVAQGHGAEVAVGQHHALGAPGGAGGVEQPRQVLGLTRTWAAEGLGQRPAGAQGQLPARRRQHLGLEHLAVVGEDQPRLGVVGDPRGFGRVQPAVDRHRHRARPPDGIQQFQVVAAVFHEQGDTLARRNTVLLHQFGRTLRGVGGKGAIVGHCPRAAEQRRALGPATTGIQ